MLPLSWLFNISCRRCRLRWLLDCSLMLKIRYFLPLLLTGCHFLLLLLTVWHFFVVFVVGDSLTFLAVADCLINLVVVVHCLSVWHFLPLLLTTWHCLPLLFWLLDIYFSPRWQVFDVMIYMIWTSWFKMYSNNNVFWCTVVDNI